VIPRTTDDVLPQVDICSRHGVPIRRAAPGRPGRTGGRPGGDPDTSKFLEPILEVNVGSAGADPARRGPGRAERPVRPAYLCSLPTSPPANGRRWGDDGEQRVRRPLDRVRPTVEHVLEMQVVLPGGQKLLRPPSHRRGADANARIIGVEATSYRTLHRLVAAHKDEISRATQDHARTGR